MQNKLFQTDDHWHKRNTRRWQKNPNPQWETCRGNASVRADHGDGCWWACVVFGLMSVVFHHERHGFAFLIDQPFLDPLPHRDGKAVEGFLPLLVQPGLSTDAEVTDIVWDANVEAFLGEKSPKEALDDAAAEIDKLRGM